MTESELRKLAQEKGVQIVDSLPLPETESLIIEDGGYTIGLNKSLSGARKKAHLAHEMGHAMKGAVYRADATLRTRSRCEYRANKWMYEHLLPLERLEEVCATNMQAPLSEIADLLDVPESVLRGAIRHYKALGMMVSALGRGDSKTNGDTELQALRVHVFGRWLLA